MMAQVVLIVVVLLVVLILVRTLLAIKLVTAIQYCSVGRANTGLRFEVLIYSRLDLISRTVI